MSRRPATVDEGYRRRSNDATEPSPTGRVPARPQAGPVRVRAHAKINLDLRVGARRADGFHDLTTILQSIAWHDTVTLRAVEGPCRVLCAEATVPEGESNLVWRATHGLWSALGRRGAPRGVAITIAKRIPVAAGLGGGTSDAIAALRGLCRLWEASPRPALLREVAATVGADGPFFLVGGTALGVGSGDEVYPLAELPRHWAVIAVPPRRVSTAAAYGWMERDVAATARRGHSRIGRARRPSPVVGSTLDLSALVNDLERPVARRRPEIRQVTRTLDGAGALTAAMTGSGSAVFGLFTRRASAVQAAGAVKRAGWIVHVTRTLDRAGLATQVWV